MYSEHVKVALEMQGTDNNTALISEAFESIQLANISEAGSALKNTIAVLRQTMMKLLTWFAKDRMQRNNGNY